jgi:hypothetical protein
MDKRKCRNQVLETVKENINICYRLAGDQYNKFALQN